MPPDQRHPENAALRARIDRILAAHQRLKGAMDAVEQRTLAQVRSDPAALQADAPLSVAELDAWLTQELDAFDALKREMLARKLLQPGVQPAALLNADELQALRQISRHP